MISRKVILIMFASFYLASLAPAQQAFPDPLPIGLAPTAAAPAHDFNRTVLPITELKFLGFGMEGRFGTGFCLDPECRFVVTNYHVAMIARPRKIKGEKVIQLYLATGPDDEGATMNEGLSVNPMRYTLSRDLAIFELRHSVPEHSNAAFSLDDLQSGQEIDIYAYPKESINPIRRLIQFHGTYKGETSSGLLAFDYTLSADKAIRPGASGGIVVDSKTQEIVGILTGISKNGEAIALATPVQSLADFVTRVQPYLAQSIFKPAKRISALLEDFYPKFAAPPAEIFHHRPEEAIEIKVLRSKAQALADSMRNFIAVQSFAWGSGDKGPAAVSAYEVRVLDGYQRFRKYPDGKKQLQNVPFPPLNRAIVAGGEWAELPTMVGNELRLRIRQAPDMIVNERLMKVFQYRADPEDGVCIWKSNFDFGLFEINKIVTVACYGEVWTDEDINILRMSEHYELPGKWKDYRAVVTYGWLQRKDEARRLIPITISAQAGYSKKLYWCRGWFTGYQVFSSRVKIGAN